jgi:hypothetical protein
MKDIGEGILVSTGSKENVGGGPRAVIDDRLGKKEILHRHLLKRQAWHQL